MLLLYGLSALSSRADAGEWSTVFMVGERAGRLRVDENLKATDLRVVALRVHRNWIRIRTYECGGRAR
jgi:hypothetical protein